MVATADSRGRQRHFGNETGRKLVAERGRAAPQRHRTFHRPVTVQTGRLDRERLVRTTRDAAEVLLRHWPISDSPKRTRAMELCLDVIRGKRPPSAARRAFVEAAREARVLVEE